MTEQSFDYTKILYNIKPILSQDYKSISKKERKIHICCFNIQSNEESESSLYHLKHPKISRNGQPKIPKFFLMYLLHRYSNPNGEDFMIFPFTKNYNKTTPLETVKKYVSNQLSIEDYKIAGYIEKGNDLYFFVDVTYNIVFSNYNSGSGTKGTVSFCLMDEICNKRKFLNLPINYSVFSIFYENPLLIYLKYNKKNLTIPDVGFYGAPIKKIAIILGLGVGAHKGGPFGTYNSLWDFQNSFKTAIWLTSNVNLIETLHRNDIDKYGRFKKFGAIIRYAVFLGRRSWHIMYQNTDPFYDKIKGLDITIKNLKELENFQQKNDKLNKEWSKKYDSLTMSPFKLKNINTIYPEYRAYVLRKPSQLIPLGLYYPDQNQKLPLFWDRNFKYNIE